jgi:hypothetical protein
MTCHTLVTDRTGQVLYSCDNPDWLHTDDHHDPRTDQRWRIIHDNGSLNIIVRGAR